VLGRTDDVINVAGHRLGTREIEESISSHGNVAEVAVVGVADALKGQVAMAFVVPRDAAAVANEVMEAPLFITPKGARLEPSNLRKVFNKLLTDAKVRRVRFHDLRHTFATALIEQGEGLAYVRDQMGHSSIKVTVDIYGHLVPGGNRQAVDKLDERVTVRAGQEAFTA